MKVTSLLGAPCMQGALVANYPWDGSEDRGTHYEACPDDAAYVHLARLYAGAHAKMAAPGGEFPQGITNGAAWYPLWGGMQVRKQFRSIFLQCKGRKMARQGRHLPARCPWAVASAWTWAQACQIHACVCACSVCIMLCDNN